MLYLWDAVLAAWVVLRTIVRAISAALYNIPGRLTMRAGWYCPRCLKLHPTLLHKVYHRKRCSVALSAPIHAWEESAIYLVSAASPYAERELAAQASRFAQLETNYEDPTYYLGAEAAMPELQHRVYLLVNPQGIRGYAAYLYLPNSRGPGRRWSLRLVWVSHRERHRGLGARLLVESVKHLGLEPKDIAYAVPFSREGYRLVSRFVKPEELIMIS
ncbi:MAG: hypothetical protein HY687_06920 [Chloroflexi bacterium]|nr:hypothetical protein [Chloroflexota bacterium]